MVNSESGELPVVEMDKRVMDATEIALDGIKTSSKVRQKLNKSLQEEIYLRDQKALVETEKPTYKYPSRDQKFKVVSLLAGLI